MFIGMNPTTYYVCDKGCGWARDYSSNEEWLQNVIEHPLYGKMTGYNLIKRDVEKHDCDQYRAAIERRKVSA